jgi:nicotinamide riboside kinase
MNYSIAIIGPESSGKTTLAKYVSKYYGAAYIKEYARDYLLEKAYSYKYIINDLIEIAFKQFENTLYQKDRSEIVVSDTEMLTMKIWAEDKFNFCPQEISDLFCKQVFDVYLLCKPDIEWEEDPLREDKDRRWLIYNLYKKYCNKYNLYYVEIEGDIKAREETVKKMLIQLNY